MRKRRICLKQTIKETENQDQTARKKKGPEDHRAPTLEIKPERYGEAVAHAVATDPVSYQDTIPRFSVVTRGNGMKPLSRSWTI
jgi:hypothetical protein